MEAELRSPVTVACPVEPAVYAGYTAVVPDDIHQPSRVIPTRPAAAAIRAASDSVVTAGIPAGDPPPQAVVADQPGGVAPDTTPSNQPAARPAVPPQQGSKATPSIFDHAIDFGEDYEGEPQVNAPPRLNALTPVAPNPPPAEANGSAENPNPVPGLTAPPPPWGPVAPVLAPSGPVMGEDSEEVEIMEAPDVEVEMMEVPGLDELAVSETENPDSLVGIARQLQRLLDDKWRWVDVGDEAQMRFDWTPEEQQELYQLMRVLCLRCIQVFKAEDYPVLHLESPLFVMGDIHGRFDDLHFFLQQFYRSGGPATSPPPPPARTSETVRVADNILVMAEDGEYEVARLSQLPSVLSSSSANLRAAGRQASIFMAGKESMQGRHLLFLGDYVDRGFASLEVIAYVLCLKALNPANVHLLRGNHELRIINQNYGFLVQCTDLFGHMQGNDLWEMVNRVFDVMPIAAIVDDRIFCVHGGIPRLGPSGWEDRLSILKRTSWWLDIRDSLDQWEALQEEKYERFREVFDDLLWADPAVDGVELDEYGFGPSNRGISVSYGNLAVDAFLEATDFVMMLRAHQMKELGFNVCKGGRVITIFSSSHYEQNANVAGAAFVSNGTIRAVTRKDF
eukprot:GGOE01058750.1.p1 GENE.GGOE01058750.1~~GGOE01058750.1.p1  ORF type:complete len:641 (-),score=188.07 GGOE01058750.1:450-2312(-)